MRQIRLDFQHFVLEDANNGICDTDAFRVTREGVEGEETVMPVLCGENSAQHGM